MELDKKYRIVVGGYGTWEEVKEMALRVRDAIRGLGLDVVADDSTEGQILVEAARHVEEGYDYWVAVWAVRVGPFGKAAITIEVEGPTCTDAEELWRKLAGKAGIY